MSFIFRKRYLPRFQNKTRSAINAHSEQELVKMLRKQKQTIQPETGSTYGYGCRQYIMSYLIGFCHEHISFIASFFIQDFNGICLHTYFGIASQRLLPNKFVDILFTIDYFLSNSTAQASGSYGYAQFGAGSLRGLL